MSARFEVCTWCERASAVIQLSNGFSGLQVCSKQEARISAEALWFQGDVTVEELRNVLRDIETSPLPEGILDVPPTTRLKTLAENFEALGHTNGPPFVWDEDDLVDNVQKMLRGDTFFVRDFSVN